MACIDNEPTSLVAGFSVSWKRTLREFPSSSHTLKYVFRKADGTGQSKVFTAQTKGANSYKLTLGPGETANLIGEYLLIGYVIDDETGGATTKEVVYSAAITVKPDPLSSTGDQRTHARRTRDLLRSAMEKLAGGTVANASVNGKSFTRRNLAELRMELARYEEMVRQEEIAERLKGNCLNPNRVLVRFGRV